MAKLSRYAESHHLHVRGPRVYRAVLVLLPSWLTGKAFIDQFKRTVLATAPPTRTHQDLGARSRGVNGERRGRFQ